MNWRWPTMSSLSNQWICHFELQLAISQRPPREASHCQATDRGRLAPSLVAQRIGKPRRSPRTYLILHRGGWRTGNERMLYSSAAVLTASVGLKRLPLRLPS